jgi:hypothetical protein
MDVCDAVLSEDREQGNGIASNSFRLARKSTISNAKPLISDSKSSKLMVTSVGDVACDGEGAVSVLLGNGGRNAFDHCHLQRR